MPKPYGEVNVELFQEIKRKILEEPRRLNMGIWQHNFPPALVDKYDFLPPCGTTACIAGWALLINGDKADDFQNYVVPEQAAKLLKLHPTKQNEIFILQKWPEEYKSKYYSAGTPLQRARVVADFIDYICGVETNA